MNKLIAVVGMSGTGKSMVTTYLESKGYTKIYFGGVIYDKMKEENIEITHESEKIFRKKLRDLHGMGVVAKILIDDITAALEKNNTVLDGLYSWDEYLILKERFDNLKLICICTDKKIRYDRVKIRKDRSYDYNDIVKRDVSEIENLAKGGPIAYSDYYILNNGDLDSLYKEVDRIINNIEEGV